MTHPASFHPQDDATFRALLQAAPDGILVVANSGIIVVANPACAKIFGYDPNELIGKPVETIVPAHMGPKHAQMRDKYFDTPHPRPMGVGLDLLAARKDGSTIPVEISLSPVMFKGNKAAIAIIRDVTDHRRLERELKHNNEELKRSNQELEQFAYVASHDLQEPLRMVSGYTQLIKRRYAGELDAAANEYIDFAVDGVKRMQALINDLLAFSRVNARGKPFGLVDLRDVADQTVSNLRPMIEECGGRVELGYLPTVAGDRTQLIQLLQNLVTNALKFKRSDVAPVVRIAAARDGDVWQVDVADNGIGMEPQYFDRIFVIFQRLHSREKYPGTGIGLSICKKVVERHGGRIWLDSAEGAGTTFHFTLPVKE